MKEPVAPSRGMNSGCAPKVAVIGGGIAGLTAAYRLERLNSDGAGRGNLNCSIQMLEASSRLGGVIETIIDDESGALFENGPDSFMTVKPAAMRLCTEIGLEDRIIETNPQFRHAFIARGGNLIPIPSGFRMMAPTEFMPFIASPAFSARAKLRMACELFTPAAKANVDTLYDESLASFVTRRFGAEALASIAQPLIGGIYTADPRELSLRATMPQFLDLERQYGSVIRGLRAEAKRTKRRAGSAGSEGGARYSMFVSLDDGMKTLVDKLQGELKSTSILFNKRIADIRCRASEAGGWVLTCENGEQIEADAVVLAVPSQVGARLLTGVDGPLAAKLRQIEYASSVVLNFRFKRDDMAHPLNGFGFVVPHLEGRAIIACSFSSVKFLGRTDSDSVILRVFAGGALQPDILALSDEDITERALKDLNEYLGITGKPVNTMVRRWPNSMPQYKVGHLKLVSDIESAFTRHNGLFACGSAFTGVGIPDCIESGESAAMRAHTYLQNLPLAYGSGAQIDLQKKTLKT